MSSRVSAGDRGNVRGSAADKLRWRNDYESGKKVYVGPYLEPGLTSEELREHFAEFGPVQAVWVARNPAGFAFVTFDDAKDAERACRALDGTDFHGKRIRVEVAHGPRSNRPAADRHVPRRSRSRSFSPGYNRRSPSYGRGSPASPPESGHHHHHYGGGGGYHRHNAPAVGGNRYGSSASGGGGRYSDRDGGMTSYRHHHRGDHHRDYDMSPSGHHGGPPGGSRSSYHHHGGRPSYDENGPHQRRGSGSGYYESDRHRYSPSSRGSHYNSDSYGRHNHHQSAQDSSSGAQGGADSGTYSAGDRSHSRGRSPSYSGTAGSSHQAQGRQRSSGSPRRGSGSSPCGNEPNSTGSPRANHYSVGSGSDNGAAIEGVDPTAPKRLSDPSDEDNMNNGGSSTAAPLRETLEGEEGPVTTDEDDRRQH